MMLRSIFIALVAIGVLAHRTTAQATTAAPSALGIWRGTSLCLVRPSPCNDEVVVYRITRLRSSDTLSVDASKMVNGQEEEMAVLTCRTGLTTTQLTCTMKNGVWRFT